MKVWRFGFGRAVSGSTFSEGSTLSHQDDVAYWGKIYNVDSDSEEGSDDKDDDLNTPKSSKIEINGSVVFGVDLEPCSVARFTMIEKTDVEDDVEDDEDDDDDDLPELSEDIGSFE